MRIKEIKDRVDKGSSSKNQRVVKCKDLERSTILEVFEQKTTDSKNMKV